jgi:hypothetical protein
MNGFTEVYFQLKAFFTVIISVLQNGHTCHFLFKTGILGADMQKDPSSLEVLVENLELVWIFGIWL